MNARGKGMVLNVIGKNDTHCVKPRNNFSFMSVPPMFTLISFSWIVLRSTSMDGMSGTVSDGTLIDGAVGRTRFGKLTRGTDGKRMSCNNDTISFGHAISARLNPG